jgi:hypothetical protein
METVEPLCTMMDFTPEGRPLRLLARGVDSDLGALPAASCYKSTPIAAKTAASVVGFRPRR